MGLMQMVCSLHRALEQVWALCDGFSSLTGMLMPKYHMTPQNQPHTQIYVGLTTRH